MAAHPDGVEAWDRKVTAFLFGDEPESTRYDVIIRAHRLAIPELGMREMFIRPPVRQQAAERIAEITGAILNDLSTELDDDESTRFTLDPTLRDTTDGEITEGVNQALQEFGYSAGQPVEEPPQISFEAACMLAENTSYPLR